MRKCIICEIAAVNGASYSFKIAGSCNMTKHKGQPINVDALAEIHICTICLEKREVIA